MFETPRFSRRSFASVKATFRQWRRGAPALGICFWLTLGVGWSFAEGGASGENPAIGEATAALEGEPEATEEKDADLLTLEGVRAFGRKELVVAREKFEQALEVNPDHVIALVNLGSLEYHSGRLEEAQTALRRATRLSPESVPAWLTLGVVAYEAGKLDLALAALSQSVYLDPSSAKAHSYLGVTVGRMGWRDGAESELLKAIELDDTYADAHFNLAVIYLQRVPAATALARRHYRRAVELGAPPDSVVEKQLDRSKETD
ncbi:MAG TPA: tetratricopeptide repeat protein [Chthoniobacteraceae bacterium]|nr:tetratricopeptide repeat protein [Chthoniobacteraceae bacterium]